MAKVWVFANIKGGSGKTSLAINVGASLEGKVLLMDSDPQQSALKWLDAAEEPLHMVCVGYTQSNIHREIQKVQGDYEYILVDTPPSALAASVVNKSALLVADLCIIPVTPSPLDIRESLSMAELVQEINVLRESSGIEPLQARMVINKLRSGTTFGQEITEALEHVGIRVCHSTVHEREAHKHAALHGTSVHQVQTPGGRAARKDITQLTQELGGITNG